MSVPKELNFFVDHRYGNWSKGLDWYAGHFDAPGKLVYGESCPAYTAWPAAQGVPERIKEHLPDVRLIYVVRDPIDRIVSHWRMRSGSGREHRPLAEAVMDESSHEYVARSLYYTQLSRYLDHFPMEQILLLEVGELEGERRAGTLRRVHRFIGVDEGHTSIQHRRRFHPTHHPLAERVPLLSASKRMRLGRAVRLAGLKGRWEEPSAELRAWLADRLRDDIAAFRALTGRDFGTWSV